jgi:hypothetical protein
VVFGCLLETRLRHLQGAFILPGVEIQDNLRLHRAIREVLLHVRDPIGFVILKILDLVQRLVRHDRLYDDPALD